MAYDETLAERVRAELAGKDGLNERKMFRLWVDEATSYVSTLPPKK